MCLVSWHFLKNLTYPEAPRDRGLLSSDSCPLSQGSGDLEAHSVLTPPLLLPGLKASLERLQLDYVDVVFANRPDPNTPMEGRSAGSL